VTEPLNPEVETNPGISSSSRVDQETSSAQASTSSPNSGTGASPHASPASAHQAPELATSRSSTEPTRSDNPHGDHSTVDDLAPPNHRTDESTPDASPATGRPSGPPAPDSSHPGPTSSAPTSAARTSAVPDGSVPDRSVPDGSLVGSVVGYPAVDHSASGDSSGDSVSEDTAERPGSETPSTIEPGTGGGASQPSRRTAEPSDVADALRAVRAHLAGSPDPAAHDRGDPPKNRTDPDVDRRTDVSTYLSTNKPPNRPTDGTDRDARSPRTTAAAGLDDLASQRSPRVTDSAAEAEAAGVIEPAGLTVPTGGARLAAETEQAASGGAEQRVGGPEPTAADRSAVEADPNARLNPTADPNQMAVVGATAGRESTSGSTLDAAATSDADATSAEEVQSTVRPGPGRDSTDGGDLPDGGESATGEVRAAGPEIGATGISAAGSASATSTVEGESSAGNESTASGGSAGDDASTGGRNAVEGESTAEGESAASNEPTPGGGSTGDDSSASSGGRGAVRGEFEAGDGGAVGAAAGVVGGEGSVADVGPVGEVDGSSGHAAGEKSGGPGVPVQAELDELADPDRLRYAVEAVLLVIDTPTSAQMLAQVLGRSVPSVEEALHSLRDEYDAGARGLDLREIAGGWRLYSRDEFAGYVERFVLDGQQARLTQAALETLAVIAYRQPVTRSRISAIRGVSVDAVVRTLLTRGLVEECGADPDTGGGLYRTTSLFLEKMGLRSLDELPSLAPLLPDTSQLDDVELST